MLRQGTAMPIMVECSSCGKQYNAPDSMAGKRVKCKQCGQVFEIPGGGEGVGDDLSALSMLEKSFHDGEAAPASVHLDLPKPPKPGFASDEGEGDIPFAPIGSGRPNTRFRFPFAAELDKYLPIVLVLGGLATVIFISLQLDPVA